MAASLPLDWRLHGENGDMSTIIRILRKSLENDMLERKQRRATKMIPELRYGSCEKHLKEYGLTTVETRKLRDQIEVV